MTARTWARCATSKSRRASSVVPFRQLALAYPGLDAINLGHRLSLPIEGDRVAGIRQTSGEFAPDPENCQTSADSVCSPFPSLARRAAEQDLPWRDASWLARLFTTLKFSHLLELSRIDDLTRRAFYELHCLKERWSVRELQRQRDSLLYERIGLSDKRDEVLKLAREGALAGSPAAQLAEPDPKRTEWTMVEDEKGSGRVRSHDTGLLVQQLFWPGAMMRARSLIAAMSLLAGGAAVLAFVAPWLNPCIGASRFTDCVDPNSPEGGGLSTAS
jgi:hypothetical protein